MDLPVLLLLAAAAIGGNVLLALALRHGAKRKAGIAELVARNGWRQETRHEGRVSREVIGDPAEGWVLETARPHQTTDGRRSYRTTWRAPELGLPSGTAVYIPPMPDQTQAFIGRMMDKEGGLAGMIVGRIKAKFGDDVAGLDVIEGRDDPATLMATPGREDAFDALVGAPELVKLDAFGETFVDAPYLVRNQDGFEVRLNRRLKDADEMAAFIEAGRALAARLRGD